MKVLLFLALLVPSLSHAKFIFQYGLNYSSQKDGSDEGDYDKSRTFHKVLLGASVNGRKTLFFGWNINSWSSDLTQGSTEANYSLTEMGPRLTYFFSDSYNTYVTAEWNPYAKGERELGGTARDISGSSMSFGLGYRFKLSRLFGLGAAIHYHNLNIKEEKIDSTEETVSDKISNVMPMLELTILTR